MMGKPEAEVGGRLIWFPISINISHFIAEDFCLFFGCARGLWRFPGQGLNLSCCSDNTRFLTHCATRELQEVSFLKNWKTSSRRGSVVNESD